MSILEKRYYYLPATPSDPNQGNESNPDDCRLAWICVDFRATETPEFGSSRPVRIFPIGSIRDAGL